MIRKLSLLSVTVIGLAGCGGAVTRNQDENTIVVWHAFNQQESALFNRIVREFEAKESERRGVPITVELQFVTYNDMFAKLRTAALGNITPDVAFVDSIKVTDLAFGRALTPLNKLDVFVERYGTIEAAREEFVAASFDAGVVNRLGETNIYGLPVQTTTIALYWNRELFRRNSEALRAAGLDPNRAPRDWDEMIAYGQVLTDPARNVFGLGLSASLWFNFPLFNMFGVGFIEYDEDGLATAAINNENMKAALGRMVQLTTSGIEGGAWRGSAQSPEVGFLNNRYAMIMMGPWMVESFMQSDLDFDISLIPAPTREEIERLGLQPVDPDLYEELGILAFSSSNVGGQTGVILRKSESATLGFEFIDYFTSESVQRVWAQELGQIPVRKAAWEGVDAEKHPFLPIFLKQINLARRIPQIPLYAILESNIYNPEIDLLLQGNTTIPAMIERMERKMGEEILARVNDRPS